ncbi:hypothetical protein C8R48DRAFT_711070 [Suillus tomentosus]|nr:hypothetical protein C8R48DRAFT_711070 [Suillus tomentosus]
MGKKCHRFVWYLPSPRKVQSSQAAKGPRCAHTHSITMRSDPARNSRSPTCC